MKDYIILISFSIFLVNCTKEPSNNNSIENWMPPDTYLKAYINGKYVEVGYDYTIGIGRKIYDNGPNDSLCLWKWHDYFINGLNEVLTLGFVKKISANDFDTSMNRFTYKYFENFIDTTKKYYFFLNELSGHSDMIWIQYQLGDKYYYHYYAEKIDSNLFSFKIDSAKYFEGIDNNNKKWMNYTINGSFKCQLVNYHNIEDTINITGASFKAWTKQSVKIN
jgi:hypothetical protein